VLLAICGILGIFFGASLDPGTPRRMGPGFFPRILSWVLILLGAAVAGAGAARAGAPAGALRWRPVILVTAAVITFGALIDRIGLIPATAATVALGAFAGRDARPREVAALAVAMAVGAAGLFVYALGLPLPLWGR
jgi:hypothetical protein